MSKHCSVTDINILKQKYSLPEVIKLKEYVDMMEDLERAAHKDSELESKRKERRS